MTGFSSLIPFKLFTTRQTKAPPANDRPGGVRLRQPQAPEDTIPARTQPAALSNPAKLKDFIVKTLDADKAEEIEVIDLQNQSALADYMIVATGRSSRQVSALADKLMERLAELGMKNMRAEGMRQGDWVVVDVGDIIIHLFRPEVREFYNIEKMWRSGPIFAAAGA